MRMAEAPRAASIFFAVDLPRLEECVQPPDDESSLTSGRYPYEFLPVHALDQVGSTAELQETQVPQGAHPP